MATEYSIPDIITFAKITQYLSSNGIASNLVFKGKGVDLDYSNKIYGVRRAVEFMYNTNPNYPSLRKVAEYLYALLGPYGLQAQNIVGNQTIAPPVLTGPVNQSVNVGGTATFSVSASGQGPFTYQWFLNGVAIPGATSSSVQKTNAQLSDSGSLYSVAVTNAGGTTNSNTASLTVTAALIGYYYQGPIDYSTNLLSGTDNVAYLNTFNISTGNPFTITFPHIGASEYIVVKYPIGQPTKVNYENPPAGVDSAGIPGLAFNTTTIGSWKYIFSRTGNTFALNNINGQVKFS